MGTNLVSQAGSGKGNQVGSVDKASQDLAQAIIRSSGSEVSQENDCVQLVTNVMKESLVLTDLSPAESQPGGAEQIGRHIAGKEQDRVNECQLTTRQLFNPNEKAEAQGQGNESRSLQDGY